MSNTAARLLLVVALVAIPTPVSRADEGDEQFSAAADQYAQKHWDAAAEQFRAFLRAHSDHRKNAQAMFLEGEALVQLGKYGDAYPIFVDLVAEQPSGPYARQGLFRAAEAAVMSGKTAEAEIRLTQFQSQHPADKLNANILMYRAVLALRSGKPAEAEKWYRESLSKFADAPTADECRFGLAHALELEKKNAAADEVLHEVADQNHSPWSERAILQLASKNFAAGKPQAALEIYEGAIRRFPDSPMLTQLRIGKGRALVELGRFDEADDALRPMAAQGASASEVRDLLARCEKAKKQAQASAPLRQPAPESTLTNLPSNASKLLSQLRSGSSRRDPKPESSTASTESPAAAPVAAKVAKAPVVESPAPTESPAVAEHSTSEKSSALKGLLQRTETSKVAEERADQTRRRAAAIRYEAAEAMMRAGEYERAITTLRMGDITGVDPKSLENRYLLAVALDAAKHKQEAEATLEELHATLAVKLGETDGSNTEPDATGDDQKSTSSVMVRSSALSDEDLAALKSLFAKVQFERANSMVAHQKYSDAIEPLKASLASPPNDACAEQAQSQLAICLAQTHQIDAAVEMAKDLKADHPQSKLLLSTAEQVAEAAYAAQKYAMAAQLYEVLTAKDNPPSSVAKGLAGLGWCHYQMGENEAAESAFGQYLEKFSADANAAEVSLAHGQTLEKLGKDQAAQAIYRQALKRYPRAKQFEQILVALAETCDRLGQDEEAAGIYARVIREYSKSSKIDEVLYNWAWSLSDLGHTAESDKAFRLLHQNHPDSPYWADATYRLAQHAVAAGDRTEAMKLLEPLLGDNRPAAVKQYAMYLSAQLSIGNEQWKEAETTLNWLVIDYPDSSLRLASEFWLAEAAYRKGDFGTAKERFKALSAKVTGHDETWMAYIPLRRAQMLIEDKQWTEARDLAEGIAQDYPKFDRQFEADYVIGESLLAEKNYDAARTMFERIVHSPIGGKTETAAMAQSMIGDSYFQQKNYAAALREYTKVDTRYQFPKWQASAMYQSAKCQEQLGHSSEAADLYARLLEKFPHAEFVAEATKRLGETTRR